VSGRSIRRTWRHAAGEVSVELRLDDGRLVGRLTADGAEHEVDVAVRASGAHGVTIVRDGRRVRATVLRNGTTTWVAIDGVTHAFEVHERGAAAAGHTALADHAVSPMTGNLTKVEVAEGDTVAQGELLFVVEAMKMEYVVRAPRAVEVARVAYAAGDQVEQGDVVVVFAEAE
jgi:acetyl/propionyl-CoA carboxylase alpha subunit